MKFLLPKNFPVGGCIRIQSVNHCRLNENSHYRHLRFCRSLPLRKTLLQSHSNLQIIGLDNFSRKGSELNISELTNLGIDLIRGDIRSQSDIDALPKVDWVIDCAANPSVLAGLDGQSSSRQLMEHNLLGTINF